MEGRTRGHMLQQDPIYQLTATHPRICVLQMFCRLAALHLVTLRHPILQRSLVNLLPGRRHHMVMHSRLARERLRLFPESRRRSLNRDLGLHPLSRAMRNHVRGLRPPCQVVCHCLLRRLLIGTISRRCLSASAVP